MARLSGARTGANALAFDAPPDPDEEARAMLTATKDLMLPATVTGSWPRPRWYDGGLWGRPLDTALLDVKFRE